MAKIRARGYLIAGVDQSTYHFGYLNPLNGRSRGSTSTWCTRSRRRSSATRTRSSSRRSRTPSGSRTPVRRGRHRGPHHDDQLRPAAAGRLLHRLLRGRPARAGPGDSRVKSIADLGGKKVCATAGSTSIATSRPRSPATDPGRGRRTGPTAWCCCSRARSPRSPPTTTSWPAGRPGPLDEDRRPPVHPRALRPGHLQAAPPTSSGSSTRCCSNCAPTASR